MSDEKKTPNPEPKVTIRKDGSRAYSYGPARGYSRPPFQQGNVANLRHGAFSERAISDVAITVAEELLRLVQERLPSSESELLSQISQAGGSPNSDC